MTPEELKLFLAKAAVIDKRIVDPLTLQVWSEILGDISYLEADAALKSHRRGSPGVYLEPGHITRKVYAWRNQHASANPNKPGTQGLVFVAEMGKYLAPEDVTQALEIYRVTRGTTARPQLSGGSQR